MRAPSACERDHSHDNRFHEKHGMLAGPQDINKQQAISDKGPTWQKYFGTDGVRGRVGVAPITPDFVMRLGYAAGKVLAKSKDGVARPTVLIGKDTRISGYMLEAALEAGLPPPAWTSAGRPMPTPAVAYLTRALRLGRRGDFGVAQSLSRQRHQVLLGQGNKLPDAVEDIEAALEQPMECVPSEKLGKARRPRTRPAATSNSARAPSPAPWTCAACAWWWTAPTARPTTSRRTCSTSWVPKSSPSATSPMA
jgi:hypothetical protein